MERKKRKEEKNMEKRNVIFLDVDGVLNSLAYHEKAGRNAPELEERALRILADIYKENDCCIVLASSWRELAPTEYHAAHSMYQYLLDSLGRYGMEIVDKTPYIQMDRPSEIAKWLEGHRGEVKNFIILDDDFSPKGYARYGMDNHLIQTVFFTHDLNEGGLQEKHKEKARKIFSEA